MRRHGTQGQKGIICDQNPTNFWMCIDRYRKVHVRCSSSHTLGRIWGGPYLLKVSLWIQFHKIQTAVCCLSISQSPCSTLVSMSWPRSASASRSRAWRIEAYSSIYSPSWMVLVMYVVCDNTPYDSFDSDFDFYAWWTSVFQFKGGCCLSVFPGNC